jgi:restriction endonuclease S subunit
VDGRLFLTQFREIGGGRFDPDYISKIHYFESLQSKYPFVAIKDILMKQPQYGANEEAIDGNCQMDTRYIRITDIDDIGNLKQFGWKTAVNIEEKYLLSYNDVLFARSGSVGKCYIHKETTNPAIFAGYLIRFVFNEKVNPDYIFYYCNSKLYWLWIDAIQRPAVQSNINSEEYKSLKIPLPPIEKQNEIALHISEIRKQAKCLQVEAVKILEDAKQKIEQLILGE